MTEHNRWIHRIYDEDGDPNNYREVTLDHGKYGFGLIVKGYGNWTVPGDTTPIVNLVVQGSALNLVIQPDYNEEDSTTISLEAAKIPSPENLRRRAAESKVARAMGLNFLSGTAYREVFHNMVDALLEGIPE